LQEPLAHRPAAVQRPDHVVLLDAGVGEEGLAERRGAGDQLDRPRLHARLMHVYQNKAYAFVLFRRIRSDEAEAPVGILRAARPDFLTVDFPVVAFVVTSRLKTCEV